MSKPNTTSNTPQNDVDANAAANGYKKGFKNKNKNKNKYKNKHMHKGKKNKCNKNMKNKLTPNEKIKFRLQKMINKTTILKERKQNEIDLLNDQQTQLQNLLNDADNLDPQTLKLKIKVIMQSMKLKRHKNMKNMKKNWRKKYKNNNNPSPAANNNNNKPNKDDIKKQKMQQKADKKLEKERRKAEKSKFKAERAAAKEERKRIKREKAAKLEIARLNELPLNKSQIGNNNILYIYIDGYNIIGCDSECRKYMRGKMKLARNRLIKLLQEFINNKSTLNIDYDINMECWFDGGNINNNNKLGDIQIQFSTKKQIVDDELVELFQKNTKENNKNILVITTDKELTIRLHDIGVKVIKSSTFYKTYLVKSDNPNKSDNNVSVPVSDNNDNKDNDDQKQAVISSGITDIDDDAIFNKFASNKMHSINDDTPDEMDETEGFNDDYTQITDDFDVTFGDDMDMDIYTDTTDEEVDNNNDDPDQ